MNEVCSCISKPFKGYSHHVIVVKIWNNTNGGERDATAVGNAPDGLAKVLYKPLAAKWYQDDIRYISGVYVEGGGI